MPSDLLSLPSSILAPSAAAKATPASGTGQGATFADMLKGLVTPATRAPETAPVVTAPSLAARSSDKASQDSAAEPADSSRPDSSRLAAQPIEVRRDTADAASPAPPASAGNAEATKTTSSVDAASVEKTMSNKLVTPPLQARRTAVGKTVLQPVRTSKTPEVEPVHDNPRSAGVGALAATNAPAPVAQMAVAQASPSSVTASVRSLPKAETANAAVPAGLPAVTKPAADTAFDTVRATATPAPAAPAGPRAETGVVTQDTVAASSARPAANTAIAPAAVNTGTADGTARAQARKAVKTSAFVLKPIDNTAGAPVAKAETSAAGVSATRLAARSDPPVTSDSGEATAQAGPQPALQTPAPSSPASMDSPPPPSAPAPAQAQAPVTATPDAQAPTLSQVATDTLAALSVSLAKRLNDGGTKFNLELHPADFGKVEVSLTVGKDGKVAAHLSFDSAATAAAFHARESELRQQLAQAGLDVAGDALSFSARDETPRSDAPATTSQNLPFDTRPDANAQNPQSPASQARAHNRRAARALAANASAAEDTDLDTHLARLRRPASRLAVDLTV